MTQWRCFAQDDTVRCFAQAQLCHPDPWFPCHPELVEGRAEVVYAAPFVVRLSSFDYDIASRCSLKDDTVAMLAQDDTVAMLAQDYTGGLIVSEDRRRITDRRVSFSCIQYHAGFAAGDLLELAAASAGSRRAAIGGGIVGSRVASSPSAAKPKLSSMYRRTLAVSYCTWVT